MGNRITSASIDFMREFNLLRLSGRFWLSVNGLKHSFVILWPQGDHLWALRMVLVTSL